MTIIEIFVVLVFIHFVADFIFQSHETAMRKSASFRYLYRHCLFYALCMTLASVCLGLPVIGIIYVFFILFVSHMIIDTYVPVFIWAKYIRKVPGIITEEDFKRWFQTPLGAILGITVDQILHIGFLFLVSYLIS